MRKLNFEEAYAGCQGERVTQQEAGELLEVSERRIRRELLALEAATYQLPGLGSRAAGAGLAGGR